MRQEIISIVKQAFREDAVKSDITSRLSIPSNLKVKAVIKTKGAGIICGIKAAEEAFRIIDRGIVFKARVKDGMPVKKGKVIAELKGRARSILSAERVVLNFLSCLSGIAGVTRQFVSKAKPFGVKILDTRKTTPNMRILERYAVRVGGGENHRFNLSDMVLIKENHIKALGPSCNLKSLVTRIRRSIPSRTKIEVEVQSLSEFKIALACGCDIIMLDNIGLVEIKKAVRLAGNKKVLLEVSGGIDLDKVKSIASLRVDSISTSKLTCGIKHLDLSLDING